MSEPSRFTRRSTDTEARVDPFGLMLSADARTACIPPLPLHWQDDQDDRTRPALIWHHLDRLDPASYPAVLDDPEITGHATEAMLAEDTRPRILITATGIVIILRGANLNPGANPSEMLALRMWVGGNRVVSVASRPIRAVEDTRAVFGHEEIGPTTPMGLIVQLAERLTDRMAPTLESIDDRLEEVEDMLFADSLPSGLRQKLGTIRREASNFRRFLEPQHQAIEALTRLQTPLMHDSHRERLIELAQQVRRDVEDLDAHREQAIVAHDELASRLAEALNRRIYLLSIVAAIILPLSLFTGLLGSNVEGIPAAEHPMAFLWVNVIMLAIGAGILALLKWKRWI